jgi:glycosyltransferase involved in cell wall biosynthesis
VDEFAPEQRPPRGVTVIVPVRNRADFIPRQLDALAAQATTEPFEVIVVDNGSSDATASVARAFVDRLDYLKVVDAHDRRGAAYARNVGASTASGELLAFCDSDDLVQPGWVDALVRAWTPESLVAGRIVSLDPSLQGPAPLEGSNDPRTTTAHPRAPFRGFLPFADSANLAIGRRDLEGVGGFDETFRFSADVELSWRAQLAGLSFVQAPNAVVLKRPAPHGWIRFRQYHRWGRAACRLYRIYRPAGMPRRPTSTIARSWLGVGIHAARGIRDPAQRDLAVRQAGWCSGYAVGSLRQRVLYL